MGDVGPAGGWIFYVDSDSLFEGWDYLECAPNVSCCFQPQGCAWPPYSTSTALGQGLENSFQWPDENPEEISTWDFTQAYNFGGHSDWFVPSKDELDVFLESSVKDFVLAEGQGYGVSSSSQYANCNWWSWSTTIGWNIGDEGCCGNKLILPVRRFKTAADNLFCDEGTVWDASEQKCVFDESVCGEGTVWDEATSTCVVPNPSDSNFDGCVQLNDLLDLLSAYGDCGAEEAPWLCGDPLEYQGYNYETVQIGEQCWFAENLRAWNYTNGDTIEAQLSNSPWVFTTNGAIAVYGEHDDCSSSSPEINPCDPEQAIELYGCLYNGFTLFDDRGLCPVGWHVPSDIDWMTLEVFLGMSETEAALTNFRGTDQGIKLKSYFGWVSVGNGSNSSGFGGLPGGMRSGWPVGPEDQGDFRHAGDGAYYWTSSFAAPPGAFWGRELNHDSDNVGRNTWSPSFGFSVRCIKD